MKRFSRLTLAGAGLVASVICASSFASEQTASNSKAILMQGFHWNSHKSNWYNTIKNKAGDINGLGVTHVWFPPPSDAASNEGYLPRQLNKLDSKYGSESQLKSAITALKNNGNVKAVADIVVNHRVGTTNWADFTNPTWGSWAVTKDDEWGQGTGSWDTGDGYSAARDLDHTNGTVRNGIKSWMNGKLKSVGFSGWRFDYSKGYSASYAGEYQNATNGNFCVGEVWTDLHYNSVNSHRQQLVDFVDGASGRCGVFDFTTKGLLNKALSSDEYYRLSDSQGKPAGGIGWWPQKMVTFVDNHDTGPSESCGNGQSHCPVPCNKVMVGYAYILTHPGVPTVYWAHVYNWGLRSDIKELIDIRKSQGIGATSSVDIKVAEYGRYAAIINGNTAVKVGPYDWSPGSGWTLAASGSQYAVWKKGGSTGGGSGSAVQNNKKYKIIAKHSGKGLDVAGVSAANNGSIHQWDYVGGNNQKWIAQDRGNGLWRFKAQHSNKCLRVKGGGTSNGTSIVQYSCSDNDDRRFQLISQGSDYYQIKNKKSNKCIDVSGVSHENGANIHQWGCGSGDNQKWKFIEVN